MPATITSSYFKVVDSADCRKGELSPPWIAGTRMRCLMECKSRFREECRNFIFNPDTTACTPVYPKPRDHPVLQSVPGDDFYSQQEGRVLTCDTAGGFHLYEKCGRAACIRTVSATDTYDNAKADCQARNAVLYIPNTYEQYAFFETVISESNLVATYIWVGFIRVGDSWIADNGEDFNSDFLASVWGRGQPNNLVDEVCTIILSTDNDTVHDASCMLSAAYLCEQNK